MSLLKSIAAEYDDVELHKLACELEKNAGFLSAIQSAGEGITKKLFDSGAKDAANVLQKDVGEVAKGALSRAVQPTQNAAAQFSHVLKDGSKITAQQFERLGPNAKMYARKLS